jgi:hypothetical protein
MHFYLTPNFYTEDYKRNGPLRFLALQHLASNLSPAPSGSHPPPPNVGISLVVVAAVTSHSPAALALWPLPFAAGSCAPSAVASQLSEPVLPALCAPATFHPQRSFV